MRCVFDSYEFTSYDLIVIQSVEKQYGLLAGTSNSLRVSVKCVITPLQRYQDGSLPVSFLGSLYDVALLNAVWSITVLGQFED